MRKKSNRFIGAIHSMATGERETASRALREKGYRTPARELWFRAEAVIQKRIRKQTHTMDMQRRPPISLPFYYGWFVVGLCFLTTITSAGVRSSPQVLILPLQEEFGWSRALIAMAISMNLLLFGVAAPISGYLIDRLRAAKIMLGSLLLLIVAVSGTIAMDQFCSSSGLG